MKSVKKHLLGLALFLFLNSSITTNVNANTPNDKPQARWVVETNVKQPHEAIIRFYDQDNTMIYEEKISGIKIDLKNPQTIKKLNKALKAYTEKQIVKSIL